ncbi:hypothetical protein RRG08_036677 [Elysia crispata]|uniref:Uncharacterized protein n=1 Tax=Elysia crispata TaxID=231223 RepID=A0AAE1DXQ7_9GAST|nr:hypothetical protein RRG08_036677 [Elysia crispata]
MVVDISQKLYEMQQDRSELLSQGLGEYPSAHDSHGGHKDLTVDTKISRSLNGRIGEFFTSTDPTEHPIRVQSPADVNHRDRTTEILDDLIELDEFGFTPGVSLVYSRTDQRPSRYPSSIPTRKTLSSSESLVDQVGETTTTDELQHTLYDLQKHTGPVGRRLQHYATDGLLKIGTAEKRPATSQTSMNSSVDIMSEDGLYAAPSCDFEEKEMECSDNSETDQLMALYAEAAADMEIASRETVPDNDHDIMNSSSNKEKGFTVLEMFPFQSGQCGNCGGQTRCHCLQ